MMQTEKPNCLCAHGKTMLAPTLLLLSRLTFFGAYFFSLRIGDPNEATGILAGMSQLSVWLQASFLLHLVTPLPAWAISMMSCSYIAAAVMRYSLGDTSGSAEMKAQRLYKHVIFPLLFVMSAVGNGVVSGNHYPQVVLAMVLQGVFWMILNEVNFYLTGVGPYESINISMQQTRLYTAANTVTMPLLIFPLLSFLCFVRSTGILCFMAPLVPGF